MRVELLSVLLGCRQVVLGAIDGNDRHSMPKSGGVPGPKLVGQGHRIFQDILEDGPRNLLARSRECASVNGISPGPEPAAPGSLEELTRLDVHSLTLASGDKREDESDQPLKGELACAGEMFGGLLDLRVDIFWDNPKKIGDDGGQLA